MLFFWLPALFVGKFDFHFPFLQAKQYRDEDIVVPFNLSALS